ncbi:hypothetical protein BpHYR1_002711 [Brachionus plicatilis]|uniref:Uncharacterized protein n=1 Tax=Brachionus plicatilis TaxID=10195 RepID=A0A3M7QHB6_BRAPC|nr:hypothetical protein BpHYR1_002711 [Brachionus plicatilis]
MSQIHVNTRILKKRVCTIRSLDYSKISSNFLPNQYNNLIMHKTLNYQLTNYLYICLKLQNEKIYYKVVVYGIVSKDSFGQLSKRFCYCFLKQRIIWNNLKKMFFEIKYTISSYSELKKNLKGVVPVGSSERRSAFFSVSLLGIFFLSKTVLNFCCDSFGLLKSTLCIVSILVLRGKNF